jgi:hypothetical protein
LSGIEAASYWQKERNRPSPTEGQVATACFAEICPSEDLVGLRSRRIVMEH